MAEHRASPPPRAEIPVWVTPEDVTLGEVYRLAARTAEDVAYVRGRVESMGDLEHRVTSLEQFRQHMARSLLALLVAIIPLALVVAGFNGN